MNDKENFLVPNVSFQVLDKEYDPEPNVRLYSTMHREVWALQIRATRPLITGKRHRGNTLKPLIATATLYREELLALKNIVDEMVRVMRGEKEDTL